MAEDRSIRNRIFWNSFSDEYENLQEVFLSGERAMAWGFWRIPETEVQLLGDVREKDILELGCGAARWLIALAKCGARPVGLDISDRQLEHARRLMKESGVEFPLLEADGENVPMPDASFDIVFSDGGAMLSCDPRLSLPEVARLLRPGGILVFSTWSPIAYLCNITNESCSDTLVNDYFTMRLSYWRGSVEFVLPYGEWIRLFHQAGFRVLDLIEPQPPPSVNSSLLSTNQIKWAKRWPVELIWKVCKEV